MQTDFLEIDNGKAVARDRIPHLSFDDFRTQAMGLVDGGGKIVQYFAYEEGGGIKLLAV